MGGCGYCNGESACGQASMQEPMGAAQIGALRCVPAISVLITGAETLVRILGVSLTRSKARRFPGQSQRPPSPTNA